MVICFLTLLGLVQIMQCLPSNAYHCLQGLRISYVCTIHDTYLNVCINIRTLGVVYCAQLICYQKVTILVCDHRKEKMVNALLNLDTIHDRRTILMAPDQLNYLLCI